MLRVDVKFMREPQNVYNELKEQAKKKTRAATKEARRTIPRIVAENVSEVYNIKKTECLPPYQRIKIDKATGDKIKGKRKAGRVIVTGETLDQLTLTYSGRSLALSRFKMSPRVVKKGRYVITYEILKGRQSSLTDSNYRFFVQNIRGKIQAAQSKRTYHTSRISGKQIQNRKLQVVKRVSVPAMVGNEKVEEKNRKDFNAYLLELLNKYYKD